jgi:hypothetical protein
MLMNAVARDESRKEKEKVVNDNPFLARELARDLVPRALDAAADAILVGFD